MPNSKREKWIIKGDFEAESKTLTAITQLLIEASKGDNQVPNHTLLVIAIYLEGHIENLGNHFYEMTELAGGDNHA